jgi:hypothetical protein
MLPSIFLISLNFLPLLRLFAIADHTPFPLHNSLATDALRHGGRFTILALSPMPVNSRSICPYNLDYSLL